MLLMSRVRRPHQLCCGTEAVCARGGVECVFIAVTDHCLSYFWLQQTHMASVEQLDLLCVAVL